MKRDMDLVRLIMFQLEKDIDFQPVIYEFAFDNKKLSVEGYSDEAVYGNLLMLIDSPFIEGERFMSGEIKVKKITWDGHELLDSIRDPGVWAKIKGASDKIGGVGLGFLWEIGKAIIKSEVKTRLGLEVS